MGQFRITIVAIGGHGCQREVKDGGEVWGCNNMHCPDCRTREFVKKLKEIGCAVTAGTLTHWPDTAGEVVDDLLTRKRKGSFTPGVNA